MQSVAAKTVRGCDVQAWKVLLLVALLFGLAAGLFGPAEMMDKDAGCAACSFDPAAPATNADSGPLSPPEGGTNP